MIGRTLTLAALGAFALLTAAPARSLVACGDVAEIDSKTHARIQEIAKTYASLGKVDDEVRVSPMLCRAPVKGELRASESHEGKKVYYLYAKDRDAYLANEAAKGQFVVKESFEASPQCRTGRLVAGKKTGLFIMLRVGDDDPAADAGWVYATTTAEGEITKAGNIASCVRCHKLAKNERLFGLEGKKPATKEEIK